MTLFGIFIIILLLTYLINNTSEIVKELRILNGRHPRPQRIGKGLK